ncbi:MAG TPA: YkgJ family cysteine cluster protein [Vicinamibacteria bacterium]|nr:YkgJ family cysteine cluster protein [Vicinamibacteria bacterium]
MPKATTPWYGDGLRFSCHQCGNCCRGSQPGWVYVTPFRLSRIAAFLGRTERSLRRDYVRKDENGDTVLQLKGNGDCVFWDEGCTIYPERPRQCRTFPFWAETLGSPEDWSSLKAFCHGVDTGRLYPLEEIRAVFKGRATKG